MNKQDRVRACYQRACLWYVSGRRMTNASLRQRLIIEIAAYPMESRIISDTVKSNLIKIYGSGGGASYVPFWA